MNQRIKNGAEYFYALKPSEFVVAGQVHPKKWHELMELMKLILEEYPKEGEQAIIDL